MGGLVNDATVFPSSAYLQLFDIVYGNFSVIYDII